MEANLEQVKVLRSIFSVEINAALVKEYIDNCVHTGSAATLFKDPHITNAFYSEGIDASNGIENAIKVCALAPTTGNKNTIIVKMEIGKLWLNNYSDRVEVISNDDANRTTREEAATNIMQSYLTPQKLRRAKKGKPEAPIIAVENVGTGKVDARILNGVDYKPTQTTYIAVEAAAGASVSLSGNQLNVEMTSAGHVVVKSAAQKGKLIHFTGLKPGIEYLIYAYAQNGKNQVSPLSRVMKVRG